MARASCSTSPTCAPCTRARAYASLREHIGDKLLTTVVRQSIAYAESAERAVSILDHRADLGSDYVLLADELLSRLGLAAARRRIKPLVEAAADGRTKAERTSDTRSG